MTAGMRPERAASRCVIPERAVRVTGPGERDGAGRGRARGRAGQPAPAADRRAAQARCAPSAAAPLLDGALTGLAPYVARTAVNAHHHADQIVAALAGRDVHIEVERARSRSARRARWATCAAGWPGDAVLVTNADACHPGRDDPLDLLLDGWDGERPRLLCVRAPGCARTSVACSTSAARPCRGGRCATSRPLRPGSTRCRGDSLYAEGRLDVVESPRPAVDCGTPADYLRANMLASGGEPVVEPGAVVAGELERSVVWSGETVAEGERLVDAIRGAGVTLQPLATGLQHGPRVNDTAVIRRVRCEPPVPRHPTDGSPVPAPPVPCKECHGRRQRLPADRRRCRAQLSARDQEILAFERQWWKYAGRQGAGDPRALRHVRHPLLPGAQRADRPSRGAGRATRCWSSACAGCAPARQRARSARRLGIEV